jgi:hypothetical protein
MGGAGLYCTDFYSYFITQVFKQKTWKISTMKMINLCRVLWKKLSKSAEDGNSSHSFRLADSIM